MLCPQSVVVSGVVMNGLPEVVSEQDRQTIAVLRDRFEAGFRASVPVRLEELLDAQPPHLQRQILRELLPIEVRERRSNDEQILPAEFHARFTAHRETIRELFPPSAEDSEQTVIAPVDELPTSISSLSDGGGSTEIYRAPEPPAIAPDSLDERFQPADGYGELGRFGQYRILRRLGGGGMGDVFLSEDTILGRKVALKLMRRELSLSPEFKARFFREARAMAALDSPFVIPILQFGEENGVPFLCMPYLRGRTLAQHLRTKQPLPQEAIFKLAIQLCDGLEAIHAAGIVHRDIKPSNLWLVPGRKDDPEEEHFQSLRILDFGLVRLNDHSTSLTGTADVLGTVNYMSPEQASGDFVDRKSDLFSVGIILYEVAAKSHPFERNTPIKTLQAIGSAQPRPPHLMDREISPKLSELIMKLLQKKAVDRPPDAESVGRELRLIRDRLREQTQKRPRAMLFPEGHHDGSTVREKPDSPAPSRRFDLRSMLAGAGAMLIGVLLFHFFTRETPAPEKSAAEIAQVTPAPPEPDDSPVEPEPLERFETPDPPPENRADGQATVNPSANVAVASLEPEKDQKRSFADDSYSEPARDPGQTQEVADRGHANPNNPDEWITPLDFQLSDVAVADSGRLLVLRPAGKNSLFLYDVGEGKLVLQLRMPTSDFVYSAGGRYALVYFPEFQELHLWDLLSREKVRQRNMSSIEKLTNILMAAGRDDRALIRISFVEQPSSWRRIALFPLTLPALGVQNVEDGKGYAGSQTSADVFVRQRTNSSLSLIAEWTAASTAYGTLWHHTTDERFLVTGISSVSGFKLPTDSGFVFTTEGTVFNMRKYFEAPRSYDIPREQGPESSVCFPAIGSSLILGLNS
ncbi:MAG TPA: serine/threonine-protein kinase, partial [Planctomycetaceae bacterium]|nr:serine/threonine-protein kinase [Planctomycetaceae bacterium]